jgi:hypothetical protein
VTACAPGAEARWPARYAKARADGDRSVRTEAFEAMATGEGELADSRWQETELLLWKRLVPLATPPPSPSKCTPDFGVIRAECDPSTHKTTIEGDTANASRRPLEAVYCGPGRWPGCCAGGSLRLFRPRRQLPVGQPRPLLQPAHRGDEFRWCRRLPRTRSTALMCHGSIPPSSRPDRGWGGSTARDCSEHGSKTEHLPLPHPGLKSVPSRARVISGRSRHGALPTIDAFPGDLTCGPNEHPRRPLALQPP